MAESMEEDSFSTQVKSLISQAQQTYAEVVALQKELIEMEEKYAVAKERVSQLPISPTADSLKDMPENFLEGYLVFLEETTVFVQALTSKLMLALKMDPSEQPKYPAVNMNIDDPKPSSLREMAAIKLKIVCENYAEAKDLVEQQMKFCDELAAKNADMQEYLQSLAPEEKQTSKKQKKQKKNSKA